MNQPTKRKIENTARTDGKYALKGIKFAEKTILETTELERETTHKTVKKPKFITQAGTIAACVDFPAPTITLTALDYIIKNSIVGENTTPSESLMSTFGATEKIMQDVLDLASIPTEETAKSIEQNSQDKKDNLGR